MKMKSSMWIVLVLSVLIASPAMSWAASGSSPKVGYFDIQNVLRQSSWGKQSQEEFKIQGERIKGEVDQKAKAFKTAREEFDKKKDVMDEKAKTKKMKELQDMQQEGEKLLMESNAKLNKLSNELSGPIIEKIMEIVKRIGRDDKYDYIFERDKAGIVFASDKDDLTKRIVDELEKVTPKR